MTIAQKSYNEIDIDGMNFVSDPIVSLRFNLINVCLWFVLKL